MKLYHGTNQYFSRIELEKSQLGKDFGCGFYLSENEEQAKDLAGFKSLLLGGTPTILTYEFQDFIIFATNFIENFDPAFMRRISSHIEFPSPDLKCRRQLWEHYIPKEMPNDIDAVELATKYETYKGEYRA